MEIPEELQTISPGWYSYLKRVADLSKIRPQPNPVLDLNKFAYCIVGEGHKGAIYFDKKFKCYCPVCVNDSMKLQEEFYKMKNGMKSKFITILRQFCKHFKSEHSN